MLLSKKFVVLSLIAGALVGCAKHPSATPVATPSAKPEPSIAVKPTEPTKVTPAYTISASTGWHVVSTAKLAPDAQESELIAVFARELDEDTVAFAGVVAGHITSSEADSYVDDVRATLNEREGSKVFKERIFKLGDDLRAYEAIEGRMTPSGAKVVVTLAVASHDKIGYVVSCGGDLEDAPRIVPACSEFVEGFRPKK